MEMACSPRTNAGSVWWNLKYRNCTDSCPELPHFLDHRVRTARNVQSTVYAIGANVDDRPAAMLFVGRFPIMAQVKNRPALETCIIQLQK